jgi:rubrerythrin
MFTSKEILDMALKIEKNGETVYRQAVKGLTNPEMIQRLTWMADEEARHAEWFMKMKSDLDTHKDRMSVDEMNRDILNDIIGKQSFSLQDIDFTDVGGLGSLMDIFIEFEKDGILFYELLRTFIKDRKVLQSLDRVIAEEYQHIETLQEMKPAGH